ncbi:hypothetical protein E2C01_070404 [Portunus trituberculatus]|uniref:Uncharacterized protein n=1 Tax=Portunus trituberculatus TaxID=210409 RepID=A0A5B7I172_PORTR|nr:hypothetical protein [Portunus trituberculatus]
MKWSNHTQNSRLKYVPVLKGSNMLVRSVLSIELINPFSTESHFYLEICVRLDHFIDIRKGLWRSED